ncbi:MAG TPA: hypothetical protein PJ989_01425 [Oligoflexia bacterium]|nr:hypothetical protein [Oligoflexia bacterium]
MNNEVKGKVSYLETDCTYQIPTESRPLILFESSSLVEDINVFLNNLKNQNSPCSGSIIKISGINDILLTNQITAVTNKIKYLEKRLEKAIGLSNERGINLHGHLEKARNFMNLINQYPKLLPGEKLDSLRRILYKECWTNLLHAHVEIAFFLYEQLDPLIGWIEYDDSSEAYPVHNLLTNPFINLSFDKSRNGEISTIEYFPRKILLSDSDRSLFFTLSESLPDDNKCSLDPDDSVNQYPEIQEPKLMRKQLDLMAIRFDESLKTGTDSALLRKVIYLKSNLGSFMPNSTTGFSCEFWIESEAHIEIPQFLNMHLTIRLPNNSDLVKTRPLLPMGGEGSMKDINKSDGIIFNQVNNPTGLSGIRLIESSSHFVADIRFAKTINQIFLKCDSSNLIETKLSLVFSVRAKDSLTFDKIQTMHFSIY